MRNLLLMFAVTVSVGCAPKAMAARGEADGSPQVAATRAPMTVEWLLQSESAGRITLLARVNRSTALRVPTAVSVAVPTGVRVISGRTSWVIEGSDSVAPVEETLVFEVLQSGPQEIVLAADAEGIGFGVHAKKAYRLGAAAKKAAAPASPGPKLEVGGHDFGQSVPAKP